MYRLLADLVLNRTAAAVIVVGTLLLGAVCLVLSGDITQDDDVLAFLPEGNSDIETFQNINDSFGGLDVALVGIETDDVFEPAFLTSLKQLSNDIREAGGVERVLSLTSVDDFTEDPMGGIITAELVDSIPDNDADMAALRTKVMSRDHVVGTMISKDGTAVLLYVFASANAETRALAVRTQDLVTAAFPNKKIYWGGAPFVSTYIFDITQADMARLTPWAVLAIVAIILVSFRDFAGSMLALVTTSMGILVSRAAMATLDVSFNIVLSAMPVILFAVGSAYSIHMLSRYYANAGPDADEAARIAALRRTMIETAPVVVAAGLTTVAGLGSFVTMDIAPMRTFGTFTALGIFTTLVLSITFVPACVRLYPLKGWQEGEGIVELGMVQITAWARRSAIPVGLVLLLVSFGGAFYVGQVDTRMDQSAFFSEDSPPDQAQKFLDGHFGGSQFLQIQVQGDVGTPEVLREIRQLADELSLLPHVTSVNHVADVVATVNHAMDGIRRVPDQNNQVGLLYGFLAGKASVRQLVTDERTSALLHVKIGSNKADVLDEVLASAQALVAAHPTTWVSAKRSDERVRDKQRGQVVLQILATAQLYGVPLEADPAAVDAAIDVEVPPLPLEPIRRELYKFLTSEECFVALTPAQAKRVAEVSVDLGADFDEVVWTEALTTLFNEPDFLDEPTDELAMMVDDVVLSAGVPLEDLYTRALASQRGQAILAKLDARLPEGGKGERYQARVAAALLDLDAPTALIRSTNPDASTLSWTVSGLPVMYNGLSKSVQTNQTTSLGMALGLVLVIMTVLFRSPTAGLLATAPTAVTLLVVYGGMGVLGIHLDIGTSMLGSIIIGAGVDYAVHLMAAWRGADVDAALKHAVLHTAPAIWTNALMVAAGFFILTLGDAKPLQNVGGLTAVAMLVAAVATFAAIPVLARRADYGDRLAG